MRGRKEEGNARCKGKSHITDQKGFPHLPVPAEGQVLGVVGHLIILSLTLHLLLLLLLLLLVLQQLIRCASHAPLHVLPRGCTLLLMGHVMIT